MWVEFSYSDDINRLSVVKDGLIRAKKSPKLARGWSMMSKEKLA